MIIVIQYSYDHCYTLEPTVKLSGLPKFLTKKPSMLEDPKKMVGKVKSVENDIKSSLGLVGYEDVSYKKWGMFSSFNLPPSFETSKFEELGSTHQYCQPQSQAFISNPLIHLQQGSSFQNPRSSIPLPQCPLNNAQLCTHPSSYPQWHAPVPQNHPRPPQIYQGTSKFKFHSSSEFAKRRKEKDNFTHIGESYASLFQRLRHRGMITPLLRVILLKIVVL
ncbi:hypothetical protein P3S68_033827 [Capsicum galapagoense]